MKSYTAFELKLVAIFAMFINHLGHAFELVYNPPLWAFFYNAVGLLTFPLMAYLLVEGFYHTSSRRRYVGRLGIFELLSILPFHYLFSSQFTIYYLNNIFATLMIGLLLLMACESQKGILEEFMLLMLAMLIALFSDWSFIGIGMIYGFYKVHQRPSLTKWVIGIVCFLLILLEAPYSWSWAGVLSFASHFGILGVIPLLARYKGERGYSPAWVKWGFYLFYPFHLSILLLVRWLFLGY